jgi:hypothetical protein
MSPSRKCAGPRGPRRSHAHRRHGLAPPCSELPAEPPPEACSDFADWAHRFAGMVAEHALTRVALRPEAGAA